MVLPDDLESLRPIRGEDNLIALGLQDGSKCLPYCSIVIHKQDAPGRGGFQGQGDLVVDQELSEFGAGNPVTASWNAIGRKLAGPDPSQDGHRRDVEESGDFAGAQRSFV
jgi:hypothetical protein